MSDSYIDNIETNNMNFKHLETTKDIVISPKNEYGDPQRPDPTHTWTAKVSDGENYVGDYAVKVNATSLIVDSEDFTKLPVGNYTLEVWEQWNDPDGTRELSIYPSPQKTIPFTIYANITDQANKEIKEIGFQDVVDQAVMNIGMNYVFKVNTIEPDQTATVVQAASDGKNYVTFNIPSGKTGPQGFRGPAGKNFHIAQTFKSVKEMEDSQGKGFEDGDFALIASDVNDPDNSKFYVWSDANKKFTYMNDLSGAQGIQGPVGPAPTLHVTKVTSLPSNEAPTFNLVPVSDGNYNVEVGIPKGDKGDTGPAGPQGLKGDTGPQGPQGDTGESAYQAWLDAGNIGTEAQFLASLKGSQGDKGDPGDNGFYQYTVDLTDAKYDRNKWYYVGSNNHSEGSLGSLSYFSLEAPLFDGIDVPYGVHNTDSGKDACARQAVLYSQSLWGAYDRKLIVLDDDTNLTTDGKRLLTFAVPSDNDLNYAFYARGGLKINITSDVPGLIWTPHTDTFVENETTIPVLNDAPDPKALGLDDDSTVWALPMSQLKRSGIWAMKMAAGGNISGRYITDLYNASASNLPEVNDLVVQPDGNVYQVTGVSNTDDGSNGGETFDLGSALFSIKGLKGDKGDDAVINVISQANYDALADKSGVYFIGGD